MKFYSTNNPSLLVDLKQAVMQSLPPDNGLYMPESINSLDASFFERITDYSFQEIANKTATSLLKGSIAKVELEKIVNEAINFPAPLVKLDKGLFILELFHGPSLAFKDFGARFMAKLMAYLNRGEDKELTILVATSGDTGGAVAAGFFKTPGVNVIILYPSGKVSALQEKQLTTLGHNITALEIDGSFDHCQAIVKKAFLDKELNQQYQLSSANSINIARLIPQSFYYLEAYKQWRIIQDLNWKNSQDKKLVFSVPSGNFGNLTAGLLAKRMGLPVERFIAANNANDSVCRYLNSGLFETKETIATISNAMDVGNPSNFQRILDLYNNPYPAHLQDELLYTWQYIKQDVAGFCFSDNETRQEIKRLHQSFKYFIDPHGAVGSLALREYQEIYPDVEGIVLETAHPSKFLPIMEEVLQCDIPVPDRLAELANKEKHSIRLSREYEEFKQWMSADR